jgi:hypothetical protein
VGQALGHSFGDPPIFCYPLLWSFGGAGTDPSGKKVTINSKDMYAKAVQGMKAEDAVKWAEVELKKIYRG